MPKGQGSNSIAGTGGGRGRALTSDVVLAEQIGGQGGSNPGGVYRGADGVERYVKFYNDPAQAHGEALANTIYNALGLSAPKSVVVDRGGSAVFASNLIKDEEIIARVFTNLPFRHRDILKINTGL